MSGSGNTYNTVLKFHCPTGFNIVGSSERRCMSNHQWSGQPTRCEGYYSMFFIVSFTFWNILSSNFMFINICLILFLCSFFKCDTFMRHTLTSRFSLNVSLAPTYVVKSFSDTHGYFVRSPISFIVPSLIMYFLLPLQKATKCFSNSRYVFLLIYSYLNTSMVICLSACVYAWTQVYDL